MSIAMGDRFDDIRTGLDSGAPRVRSTRRTRGVRRSELPLAALAGVAASLAPIATVGVSVVLGVVLVLVATLASGWPSNLKIGFGRATRRALFALPVIAVSAAWFIASDVAPGIRAAAVGLGAVLGVVGIATALAGHGEGGTADALRSSNPGRS